MNNTFEWTTRFYYLMRNKTSGKLYLGQTTSNLKNYLGSGVYWKKHCRAHGGLKRKNIECLWHSLFTSRELADLFLEEFEDLYPDYFNGGSGKLFANQCREDTNDSPFFNSEIAGKNSRQRVADGTHNLLGPESNNRRIENGTHNLLTRDDGSSLGKEIAQKRVADGTHHLLGPTHNLTLMAEGRHHFIGESHPMKVASKNGNHPWQGESNPTFERLENGTHNFIGDDHPMKIASKNGNHPWGQKLLFSHQMYPDKNMPKANWARYYLTKRFNMDKNSITQDMKKQFMSELILSKENE